MYKICKSWQEEILRTIIPPERTGLNCNIYSTYNGIERDDSACLPIIKVDTSIGRVPISISDNSEILVFTEEDQQKILEAIKYVDRHYILYLKHWTGEIDDVILFTALHLITTLGMCDTDAVQNAITLVNEAFKDINYSIMTENEMFDDSSDPEELFEMANIDKEISGLNFSIYSTYKGVEQNYEHHLPRIKVETSNKKRIPISVTPDSKLLINRKYKKEDQKRIEAAIKYVNKHYKLFEMHWNGDIDDSILTSTLKLIHKKKIPDSEALEIVMNRF